MFSAILAGLATFVDPLLLGLLLFLVVIRVVRK